MSIAAALPEESLDLAKEYLQNGKLAEVTHAQFGEGCSEYAARAIREYYGV